MTYTVDSPKKQIRFIAGNSRRDRFDKQKPYGWTGKSPEKPKAEKESLLLSWQKKRLIVVGIVVGVLFIIFISIFPFRKRIIAVFQESDTQNSMELLMKNQEEANQISAEIDPLFEAEGIFVGIHKYDEAIATSSSDDVKVFLLWNRASALDDYAEFHQQDLTDYILSDLYAADEISQSAESAARIAHFGRKYGNDALVREYTEVARRRNAE